VSLITEIKELLGVLVEDQDGKVSPAKTLFWIIVSMAGLWVSGLIVVHSLSEAGTEVSFFGIKYHKSIPSIAPESQNCENFDCIDIVDGSFNYSGSTTWIPLKNAVNNVLSQGNTGNFTLNFIIPDDDICSKLRVSQAYCFPGSDIGIQMLLADIVDFSLSSRSLSDEEKGQGLIEIPVAVDAIAFVVHPDLEIPGLTLADIENIYLSDENLAWDAFGGPPIDIIPYTRSEEIGGTVNFLLNEILKSDNFGGYVKRVGTMQRGVQLTGQTKGAIFYGSAAEILEQCAVKPVPVGENANQLVAPNSNSYTSPEDCINNRNTLNVSAFKDESYPIFRKLSIVVKGDDENSREAGESYAKLLLTREGQNIIQSAGFVRLR
jgi:phosphate transport system substrate-binding protein